MISLNEKAEHLIQDVIEETPINLILATGMAEFVKCKSCPITKICDCYTVHNRVTLGTCIDMLHKYLEGELDDKIG